MSLEGLKSRADTLSRLRASKLAALEAAKRRADSADAAVAEAQQAQQIAQAVAQESQAEAHSALCGVVQKCLAAVLDDPPTFAVSFERKRGRTEARFVVTRGGEEIDLRNGQAGGEIDLISFALRLVCLCGHTPPVRRLLVLDEPFKNLDRVYRPVAARLLEELSREAGVQILMVTHDAELKVGEVVAI